MPQMNKIGMEAFLSSTFEEASASLLPKLQQQVADGSFWTVESHGVVLLPPTADKREAEMVYGQSMSTEKGLLRQRGCYRNIEETNAPHLLRGR